MAKISQHSLALVAAAVVSLTMTGGVAAQTLTLPGHATLQVGQRGAATTITFRRQGITLRASLPLDDTIYAHTLETSELLGALPDAFAVISSDYSSNPAGGNAQCGAGSESMVRVIALQPVPHQTFSQLVDSCWTNIEAENIGWDNARQRLFIERITVGTPTPDDTNVDDIKAFDTLTVYQLASDGAVTVVSTKQLQ